MALRGFRRCRADVLERDNGALRPVHHVRTVCLNASGIVEPASGPSGQSMLSGDRITSTVTNTITQKRPTLTNGQLAASSYRRKPSIRGVDSFYVAGRDKMSYKPL